MFELNVLLTLISPYTAVIPAICLMVYGFQKTMNLWLNPWNTGMILLWLTALISSGLNHSPLGMGLSFALLLYLGVSVYFQNTCQRTERAEVLMRQVWQMAAFTGFLGLLEKLLSYFWDMRWISNFFWSPSYIPTKEAYRIYSTFGNPNVAGDWFGVLFLVGIFLARRVHGKRRMFYTMGSLLFLTAMVFTGSQGAAAGLGIGILVFAALCDSRRGKIFLGGIFVVLLFCALVLPEMNQSMTGRMGIWAACMDLIRHKPVFGWGVLGIYQKIGEIHGHNFWISIMTMFGTVGLVLFTGMLISLYRSLMTLHRHGNPLVPVMASTMAMLTVHGVVDFTIFTPQGGMLFVSLGALVSALALRYERHHVLDQRFLYEAKDYIYWYVAGRHHGALKPPGPEWTKKTLRI